MILIMKQAGFTVVEMMIALAIMAIVVSVGVPSFKDIIRSSEISANSSALITALNYARMEAVKRNDAVQLSQQDGASWTQGLVVWVDSDGDASYDAGEELRLWEKFKTSSSVSSAVSSFVFNPSGAVNNSGELTLCDDRSGETGRKISILATGAVYAEKNDCD